MSAFVRRLGFGGTLCLALIVTFALLALFAPWLSPYPDQGMGTPNVIAKLKPPAATFWLGTDHLGRDVLSRVIFGARVSMSAGLLIVAFSLLIGLPVGLCGSHRATLRRSSQHQACWRCAKQNLYLKSDIWTLTRYCETAQAFRVLRLDCIQIGHPPARG